MLFVGAKSWLVKVLEDCDGIVLGTFFTHWWFGKDRSLQWCGFCWLGERAFEFSLAMEMICNQTSR